MIRAGFMAWLLGSLFLGQLASGAAPAAGYYRQSWQDNPGDAWRTVGIVELADSGGSRLKYIAGSYCGSGLSLPEKPATVQIGEDALNAQMSFPPLPQRGAATQPANRVVEYRLKSDGPGTYSGEVLLDGRLNGRTRLEHLADHAALATELQSAMQRIKSEQIVRDQNVKIAYSWVLRYQRDVATEEALSIQAGGGPMPNTRTPLLLAAARATHQTEQANLLRAHAAEQEVSEMLARLKQNAQPQ